MLKESLGGQGRKDNIWSAIWFPIGPISYMEKPSFMTYTAASQQEAMDMFWLFSLLKGSLPMAHSDPELGLHQCWVVFYSGIKPVPNNVQIMLLYWLERELKLLLKGSFTKNENTVINYSPSCHSKPARPSFIFETQMNIFLMKSARFLTLNSNATTKFKS